MCQLQLPNLKGTKVRSIVFLDLSKLCSSAIPEAYVVQQRPATEHSPFLFKALVYSLIGVHVFMCRKENPLRTVVMTNDEGLDKNRTFVPAFDRGTLR